MLPRYAWKHKYNASVHVHVLTGKAKKDVLQQPCMLYHVSIANGIEQVRQRAAVIRMRVHRRQCTDALATGWSYLGIVRKSGRGCGQTHRVRQYIGDHGLLSPASLLNENKV
jgi:hypothetical protein